MKKIILAVILMFCNQAFAYESSLINSVYKIFETHYIKGNVVEELAVSTLKSLKNIDKNISIANDGEKLSLYYMAKKIKIYSKPKENGAKEWSTLSNKVIADAINVSPILRKKEFSLDSILLTNSVAEIDDKSSHFYSVANFKDYKLEYKRNFNAKLEGDKLYITAKNINETTYNSIKTSIEKNADAKEVILNLRGNQGGSLKSAVNIINLFVDGGIIFTTIGRDKKVNMYQALEGDVFGYKPVSVLVDEKTASAAELIAFVLSESGRAKVFGRNTFGKNSVQTLFLIDGAGLSITTDYFFDANGNKATINFQSQQNP